MSKHILLTPEEQHYLQIREDLNKPRGDGLKVGLKTRLHEGQIDALKNYYHHKKSLILQPCGRKFGKMNRLDELIFTPGGYKKFGDLLIGSEVFDEQGKVQRIIDMTPVQFDQPAYKIHFCNGTTMEVGEEHQWFTWTRADRKNERRGLKYNPSVKSTKEIFETQLVGKEYNHSIPYTKPIELPEKQLPIDPYLLGLWLGDGSSYGGGFTTSDQELLDAFIQSNYDVTSNNGPYAYYIKGFCTELRENNLLKNKHIPHLYLLGSIDQRLSLLQGLMDTDGTINKLGNHCTFDNTNRLLAEGVYHLIASLGMKPIWKECIPKLNGKECSRCYRIFFRPLMPVFRLKRKLDKIVFNNTKRLHHTITKVEKISSSPMRCISITGDSHLYLIGKSLIPTHNSEQAMYFLWDGALFEPGSANYYIAPEGSHGRKIVWDNWRLQRFLGEDSEKYIKTIKNQEMKIEFKNRAFIQVVGSENFGAANGLTPSRAVYDEMKMFHPRWHIDFAPNLVAKAAPLLIIGTLPAPGDRNAEQYFEILESAKKDPRATVIYKSTWDNPINHLPAQKQAIEDEIRRLEERGEHDVVQREYFSRIVPGGKRSVFPMFAPHKHVFKHEELLKEISKDKSNLEWYCIADPGSTTCFAVLFIAINPYTKMVYILNEIYEQDRNMTSTKMMYPRMYDFMKKLYSEGSIEDEWFKGYDEAAAWFSIEVMNEYGVYFTPTNKAHMKKDTGLSLIKDQLIHQMVKVSDQCPNLISEMEMYATDSSGEIRKARDHAIDAYRYFNYFSNYSMQEVLENRMREESLFKKRMYSIEDDLMGSHGENNWESFDFVDSID